MKKTKNFFFIILEIIINFIVQKKERKTKIKIYF